ncbi:MAG: sel1 repeat family protein [Alphaproteobacteria bacterium]|nr:sel1 repeat family protein [Alphaproteobacteria bacterium]
MNTKAWIVVGVLTLFSSAGHAQSKHFNADGYILSQATEDAAAAAGDPDAMWEQSARWGESPSDAVVAELSRAGMTGLDTGGALAAWRKEYGQGLREPTPATAALLRQRAAKDPPGLLAIQFEALALTGQWEPPYDGGTPVPNLLVLAKRGEPAAIAFLCRTAGLPFILMRNHAPFCAKGVALGQPESAYHLARLHHGRADDFHDGFIDKIDEALHIKPSLPRALALYRQAAQGGHAGAQARLATLLAAGRGVKPDPVQARELAERSAGAGWPEGQAVLGILLLKGQGGPADIGRALMLLDQAARSGQRMAQFTLATLAFRGQYRPRDFLDALTWVRLAQLSRRGDPPEAEADALLLEPLRRTRHVARTIGNPVLDLDARIKAATLRKELHESGEWQLEKPVW